MQTNQLLPRRTNMAEIIDIKSRLRLGKTQKEEEEDSNIDPVKEYLGDTDIMDIFMSVLLTMRLISISETVSIKMAEDQIFIESSNFMQYNDNDDDDDNQIESAVSLTKVASMFITDEDGEMLELDELVLDFQAMLHAVMHTTTDEDEDDELEETE